MGLRSKMLRATGTLLSRRLMSSGHPALTALSEEDVMLQEMVRKFCADHVTPHVLSMDESAKMRPETVKEAFNAGLMGIETPSELQGAGMSFFQSIIVIEELARIDPAVSVMVDVQNTLANVGILKWGSDEQKARWLPRLSTDTVASFCLSEWGSGSDAFALKTKAKDCGSHWELNGSKAWITNSGEADLFVVFATSDPALGYKGISAFVVESRDTPGLSVQPSENKLGIRASSTCEVVLEDVKVPKENVLGPLGKGYKIAIESLNEGRIGIGAQMVGLAQGALDIMIPYVKERKQFGKPISDFQGVQFMVGRAAMEVETARLLVYEAARRKDAGLPFLKHAAMAKLYGSEVAERTASVAVEALGGMGFVKESGVEKLFRDSKIGAIYEGTSNINLSVIAKAALGEGPGSDK